MGGVGNHANWLVTNRLLNRDGQCLFSHDQPIPDHDNLKWNDLASDRAHLPLHSSNGQAGLLERASELFCDPMWPSRRVRLKAGGEDCVKFRSSEA